MLYIIYLTAPHCYDEIDFSLSFFPHLSEENSEEVHIGKISFSSSEVLGRGTAGTFVFRYVCVFFTFSLFYYSDVMIVIVLS